MKKAIFSLSWIIVGPFLIGTAIWAAVDIFDLYTENQFTGRVRAFDIEYWNAVLGTFFFQVARALIGGLVKWGNTKMEELD